MLFQNFQCSVPKPTEWSRQQRQQHFDHLGNVRNIHLFNDKLVINEPHADFSHAWSWWFPRKQHRFSSSSLARCARRQEPVTMVTQGLASFSLYRLMCILLENHNLRGQTSRLKKIQKTCLNVQCLKMSKSLMTIWLKWQWGYSRNKPGNFSDQLRQLHSLQLQFFNVQDSSFQGEKEGKIFNFSCMERLQSAF